MRSSSRRSTISRSSISRPSLERSSFGKRALFVLCLSLTALISAGAVPKLLAKKKDKAPDSGANEQKRAVQALNRLTFGPRPGDIQQVMAMGVDRWIELQLHPEKIPDSAVEARLAPLRTLRMSSKEIVENFPDNPMVKQVMDGKRPMPSDSARRAVYQVQIARLEEKQQQKSERIEQAAAPAPANVPVPSGPAASDTAKTEAELAAAAAASPDSTPGMAADGNAMSTTSMNATSAANGAPANEMSIAPPADGEALARGRGRSPPPGRSSLCRFEGSGAHRSASRPALQESDGDVDRRASGVRRLSARRQGAGLFRGHGRQAERNADGHE